VPGSDSGAVYFTIDDVLFYVSFFADFGPLDINSTHKFFTIVEQHLKRAKSGQRVIFYSSNHSHRRTNATTLIAAYMV
jgi:cell division cycle 14